MKRIIRCLVLALLLCLVLVSVSAAGELEDKLIEAAESGNSDAVAALINRGANLNVRGHYGNTALIEATVYAPDPADVVLILLKNGAD